MPDVPPLAGARGGTGGANSWGLSFRGAEICFENQGPKWYLESSPALGPEFLPLKH